MILTIVAVIIAFATVLTAKAALRGQLIASQDADGLVTRLRPVDIPSMRNLIDSSQDSFLRRRLSSADFRQVQRARTRAALAYVALIAHNAAVLVQIADIEKTSSDAEMRSVATEIAAVALAVRVYAILALCKLGVALVLPVTPSSLTLADAYERLQHRLSGSSALRKTSIGKRLALLA